MVSDSAPATRLLVTAGPTWGSARIPVMREVLEGAIGIEMATLASSRGFEVTLLLGPGARKNLEGRPNLRVLNYLDFEELAELLRRELSNGYQALIHGAAVARVDRSRPRLGRQTRASDLVSRMKAGAELLDRVKLLDPDLVLVSLSLEADLGPQELTAKALDAARRAGADLAVLIGRGGTVEDAAVVVEPRGLPSPPLGLDELAGWVVSWLENRLQHPAANLS